MSKQNTKSSPSSFGDFYLSQATQDALAAVNYITPTPVQAESIPLSMAGIDLIVQSQTGTGKTAAFAIPTLEMIDDYNGIEALVLAPTRELAQQVSLEFKRLGEFKNLGVAAIYGGAKYEPQREALKTAQVLCATPGRLLDFLKQKEFTFDNLRMLILDEADEMLSMGFERELQEIMEFLPEERQSLLFSATVTDDVRDLAQKMLFYPEFLSYSSDSVANVNVTHEIYSISGIGRTRDLVRLIEYTDPETAIIFANTKADTFMVTNFLKRHNYRAEVLNGDLPQKERERTLKSLREGNIDYLVATDVAARGIDINDLSHVINYTLPDSPEVYVHRTGRTGRAGKQGTAISLASPAEQYMMIQIRKRVELPLEELELPTTREIVQAKRSRLSSSLGTRISRKFPNLATQSTLNFARELIAPASSPEQEEERVELIAQLIALSNKVLSNAALAAPPAAPVSQETTEEQEQEDTATEAVTTTDETLDTESTPNEDVQEASSSKDEDDEAQDSDDDSRRGNRRRRSRRPETSERSERPERAERAAKSSRSSDEDDDSDNDSSGKRDRNSRRRHGSRRGENSSTFKEESQEQKPARESSSKPRSSKPSTPSFAMRQLSLNQGKSVFKDREHMLEFLVFNSGMDEEDFGKIKLERNRSFVEVRTEYFYDVMEALNSLMIDDSRLEARPARRS